MKSLLLTVMAVLTASFVFAEAVNVTAYQRWPWNGKVDITFTIPEPDTDETRIYSVEYYVSIDGGEPIPLTAIEGDGVGGEGDGGEAVGGALVEGVEGAGGEAGEVVEVGG